MQSTVETQRSHHLQQRQQQQQQQLRAVHNMLARTLVVLAHNLEPQSVSDRQRLDPRISGHKTSVRGAADGLHEPGERQSAFTSTFHFGRNV